MQTMRNKEMRKLFSLPTDGQNTDWTRLFLYGLATMFVVNLVMFIGLFGWTAVAVLVISALVLTNVATVFMLLRAAHVLTATEEATQHVLDEIAEMGDEFDQALKDTVWMEDIPQARKASKLLYDAKFTLLNAPATFHKILAGELGNSLGPRYSSDSFHDESEVLQPDDEFIEKLTSEILTREERSGTQPSQFARPLNP